MSAYASIEDLRSQLGGNSSGPSLSQAYRDKMLHALPETKTVDRAKFILDNVRGKRVLEFGASGPMHEQVKAAASAYVGVDREAGDGVKAFDLDDVRLDFLPDGPAGGPEIILCGEVIEHLSNPGWFLTRLKKQFPGVGVIITVPNAFASNNKWLLKGLENVNIDHCMWFSPRTMATLLERAGYKAGGLFYYNGQGPIAEGLVVVTE